MAPSAATPAANRQTATQAPPVGSLNGLHVTQQNIATPPATWNTAPRWLGPMPPGLHHTTAQPARLAHAPAPPAGQPLCGAGRLLPRPSCRLLTGGKQVALAREAHRWGDGVQLRANSSNSQFGTKVGPAWRGTTFSNSSHHGGNTH